MKPNYNSLYHDLNIIFSYPNARFDLLARKGGLNPETDFIAANLSGIDLTNAQLENFDFTMADLRGTSLRRAKIDKTTLLFGAILDIEDKLWLSSLNRQQAQESDQDRDLESYPELRPLFEKCVALSKEIDEQPDNMKLRYKLAMVIASIGTFAVGRSRIDDALYHFNESRRIMTDILDTFEPSELGQGVLLELSAEIKRYEVRRKTAS